MKALGMLALARRAVRALLPSELPAWFLDNTEQTDRSVIIWTTLSSNTKTGAVLTAWIGVNPEETALSCLGCPLLESGCYYWSGATALGHLSADKGYKAAPERYTLPAAIAAQLKAGGPRVARLSGGGDIGRHAPGPIVGPLLASGFVIIGYTHHWREAKVQGWRPYLLASCETPAEVDEATRMGWRCAMSAPVAPTPGERTPKGTALVQCPATKAGNEAKVSTLAARSQAVKGLKGNARKQALASMPIAPKPLTCAACRLCSPTATSKPVAVVFPAHGNEARSIGRPS